MAGYYRGRRGRSTYEEPEHVKRGRERAQKSNASFHHALNKLTKKLVKVSSEEMAAGYKYRVPEWIRTRKGERTLATMYNSEGSEATAYLKRIPGIGIVIHDGLGATYYLLPRVAKRVSHEVKAMGGRNDALRSALSR